MIRLNNVLIVLILKLVGIIDVIIALIPKLIHDICTFFKVFYFCFVLINVIVLIFKLVIDTL